MTSRNIIIRIMSSLGEGEKYITQIAKEQKLNPVTISKYLRRLYRKKYVTRHKVKTWRGVRIYYRKK